MSAIYLDSAATAKPKPEVIEAMLPYLTGDKWHNPSSLYAPALKVKQDMEDARKVVADFIGAEPEEIVFTSSGSESNCMALRGFADKAVEDGYAPVIITSAIEHKSIMSCVDALNLHGAYVEKVGVDSNGFINLGQLEELLSFHCSFGFNRVLVSMQYANSEIGTVQHIKEISDMIHQCGATFHTDAVQAAGQIPIDVKQFGIDMMSVSGHKLGCPRGSAFLYKNKDAKIGSLIFGSQESGLRGGTENVAGIIGLARAVELAKNAIKNREAVAMMRSYLIDKLEAIGCKLNGSKVNRLPNNVNVQTGVNAESLLLMLDMSGFYVSTGSACNSKSIEPSYVLKGIGLSDEEANSSIRLTISQDTTFEETGKAVEEIERSIKLIKGETITWGGEI